MGDWNSRQYLMFENERTQPAVDLANRICINNPRKIADIGCGPGNSTHVLEQRFNNSYILGVDNSENMIEKAKKDYPDLDFKLCDVGKELLTLDHDFDIVFSNACIQWLPDHESVLKNMMKILKPGGILAVQIPMNYNEPIHKIIREVTTNDKWKSEFNMKRCLYNLSEGEYFDLLSEISSEFSMWTTTYFHKLNSHNDILEWYRGTGLRPYLNALNDEKRKLFEKDILDRVKEEYPEQNNGKIIFRFPRLFFIAKAKK